MIQPQGGFRPPQVPKSHPIELQAAVFFYLCSEPFLTRLLGEPLPSRQGCNCGARIKTIVPASPRYATSQSARQDLELKLWKSYQYTLLERTLTGVTEN